MKILSFVLCVMLFLGSNVYGEERCPSDTLREFFRSTRTKTRANVGAAPRIDILRKNSGFTGIQISVLGTGNILMNPQATGPVNLYPPTPHESFEWLPGYLRQLQPTWCGVHVSMWVIKEQKVKQVELDGRKYYRRTIVWEHLHLICTLTKGHRGSHHGKNFVCDMSKKTTVETQRGPFVNDPKDPRYKAPPKPQDP